MQHGNSGKEQSELFPPGNHYKGRKETSFLPADSYKYNVFFVKPHFCISTLKYFQKFSMTSLQNSILIIYSDEENQHTMPGGIIFLLAK